MGVPALATRERFSGEFGPAWQQLARRTDGSSQIRANATPGCAAKPSTILRKTGSTCCSVVTVTAKERSDSEANDAAGDADISKALPSVVRRASTLAWSDRRFNGRETCLRHVSLAAHLSNGAHSAILWYWPSADHCVSACCSIPKSRQYHRPIVSFSRFWCYRFVASDRIGCLQREFFRKEPAGQTTS